jgi:hypothetical protein
MLKIDVKTKEGLTPYRTELHTNILASGQLGRYIIEDHSGQMPLYHVSPRDSFLEILPSPYGIPWVRRDDEKLAKNSFFAVFFSFIFEFSQHPQHLFDIVCELWMS